MWSKIKTLILHIWNHYIDHILIILISFLLLAALGHAAVFHDLPELVRPVVYAVVAGGIGFIYSQFVRRIGSGVAKVLTETEPGAQIGQIVVTMNTLLSTTSDLLQKYDNLALSLNALNATVGPWMRIAHIDGSIEFAAVLGMDSQTEIIATMLKDYTKQVTRRRYILSTEGYLTWLSSLAGRYASLYCVNRTLPVYWFAPRAAERAFVRDYRRIISHAKITIRRVTVVREVAQLREQVGNAVKSFAADHESRILWFLVLMRELQQECERLKLECAAKPAFEQFISLLKPDVWEFLANQMNDIETRPNLLDTLLQETVPAIGEALLKLADDTTFTAPLDATVRQVFVTLMGSDGSYWAAENYIQSLDPTATLRGEAGVFCSSNAANADTAELAFEAAGDVATCVLVQRLAERELYDTMTRLFRDFAATKGGATWMGAIGGL
ncbi:MAG TPA: hypothetical protein VI670_22090 [Thermoanaerobaculia bacterium]|jgi:hypothetical protein